MPSHVPPRHPAWSRRAGSMGPQPPPPAMAFLFLLSGLVVVMVVLNFSGHHAGHDTPIWYSSAYEEIQATIKVGAEDMSWHRWLAAHNSSATLDLQYPLWWAAPFLSPSGFGSEALSYVMSLVDLKLVKSQDLYLSHSGDDMEVTSEWMRPDVFEFLKYQYEENLHSLLPQQLMQRPAIVICHSQLFCWRHSRRNNGGSEEAGCPCPLSVMDNRVAYRIGRTMWETNGLPPGTAGLAEEVDEVWVPSEFNRQSFAAAGIPLAKLRVVPQGVNTSVFDPNKVSPVTLSSMTETQQVTGHGCLLTLGCTRFRFLSIFKWESRKGWDILLKAFLQEFKADEGVELHLVTHAFAEDPDDWASFIQEQLRSLLEWPEDTEPRRFHELPRIYVYGGMVSEADYPSLFKGADCFVLPSRGEGWGRPQMEAMTMGLPVISTNWSGLTAFMKPEVTYPLEIEGLQTPDDEIFQGSGQWALPSLRHLRQLMRHVVTHPEEARARGQAARQLVLKEFSTEVVAQQVYREIMRIHALLAARTDASIGQA